MTSELLSAPSIVYYPHRLQIASHGVETITARLAKDYASFTEVAEKHGIEIAATSGGTDLTPGQVLDIVRTAVHIDPRGQRITLLPRSAQPQLMAFPTGDWR